MLTTLIQIYEKKNIIPFQEGETNWNFIDCQMSYSLKVLYPKLQEVLYPN